MVYRFYCIALYHSQTRRHVINECRWIRFRDATQNRQNISDNQSKENAKIRNLNTLVSHLTQNTIWESDKNTRKNHIKEIQEATPFPAGDHKAARNRQYSMTKTNTNTNNKMDPQKKRHLGTVSKKLLEGFTMFMVPLKGQKSLPLYFSLEARVGYVHYCYFNVPAM